MSSGTPPRKRVAGQLGARITDEDRTAGNRDKWKERFRDNRVLAAVGALTVGAIICSVANFGKFEKDDDPSLHTGDGAGYVGTAPANTESAQANSGGANASERVLSSADVNRILGMQVTSTERKDDPGAADSVRYKLAGITGELVVSYNCATGSARWADEFAQGEPIDRAPGARYGTPGENEDIILNAGVLDEGGCLIEVTAPDASLVYGSLPTLMDSVVYKIQNEAVTAPS